MRNLKGCGNILGINFLLFWELIFFLWFQLEVETFQVGVGCPCRGGRPKKKNWRGVGGEGAAPPPQMHWQNMLRDSPSVRIIFGALGSLKIWCCVQKLVVSSQNFLGLRCSFFVSCVYIFLVVSGSSKFWDLRFTTYLGPYLNILFGPS